MTISHPSRGATVPDELAQELYDRISELWIIDAHEHLAPEKDRVAMPVDAINLFENYPRFDLLCAGMSMEDFTTAMDWRVPLDERWEIFSHYLPLIRHTSLTRATLLGVRELYGFDDITEDNYREVSDAMQAANRPGIYRRAFRERGRILVALNQPFKRSKLPEPYEVDDNPAWWQLPEPGSFFIPQIFETQLSVAFGVEPLTRIQRELGLSVSSLASFVDALEDLVSRYRDRGLIAIKLNKTTVHSPPQESKAVGLFDRVLRSHDEDPDAALPLSGVEQTALRDFVAHALFRIAGDHGQVIIHHCGHRGPWQDYRTTDPTHLVPVFMQYPDTRFELYHAGMPWVRETGMICKAYPNVWLNMTWGHSIARQMAISALDEWLDMIPVNKITAFGGDTHLWVEWTLGDLVQTRQNLSAVLAKRIREGLLTENQALDLARMMLYENPKNLYHLGCKPGDDFLFA